MKPNGSAPKRRTVSLNLPPAILDALDREAARLAPMPGARCSRSEAAVRVLASALLPSGAK
jgi:hypothetical protein